MNKQVVAGAVVVCLLGVGWTAARLTPAVSADAASSSFGVSSTSFGQTITVTGTADKQVAPNLALIDTGITTRASSASAAQSENDAAMRKLQSALVASGIPKSDIQTTAYNIYANYGNPGPNHSPVVTGFVAQDDVEIKLTDLAKVGSVLDELTKSGANQINNVSYQLQNPSTVEQTLYQAAIADADARAQAIATSLGATITGVRTVSTSDSSPMLPMSGMAMSASAALASAPVNPQSQDVTTSVQVTYTISGGSSTPGTTGGMGINPYANNTTGNSVSGIQNGVGY